MEKLTYCGASRNKMVSDLAVDTVNKSIFAYHSPF
jgi:hypothetical protein